MTNNRKTIIKNGLLVTPSDTYQSDILIDCGLISKIGHDLSETAAKVIDASGKMVFPGGIDPHTHFDLPMFDTISSDDHYTGHKAAAFGGTTTVMDFVPQTQGGSGLLDDVAQWRAKADPKASIDLVSI